MKKTVKGIYLLVSSLVISLLHLPFAFAKTASANRSAPRSPVTATHALPDASTIIPSSKSVYDSLDLDLAGLSRQAYDYAVRGYERLVSQGKLLNQSILAIVDFSQPSSKKRLYVLDMKNYKVLFNTLVAHGRNSGKEWATYFSNKPSSYKSSPGFYVTGETYSGSNGYSLKLNGVENGINDKAMKRAIVLHGADYVNESYIYSQGYIGRSQGCPAVPLRDARNIINTIRDGACLYIHTPDQHYFSRTVMFNDHSRG
jgi:L,D-transpeptidase catalytic domain